MCAFKKAKNLIDIKRFDNASTDDGLLWAENIRCAIITSGLAWKRIVKSPCWQSWEDFQPMECLRPSRDGISTLGHSVNAHNLNKLYSLLPRRQKTVGMLQAANVVEGAEMIMSKYDDDSEFWNSCDTVGAVDEVFSDYFDPVATVNLHAPDSMIIEDFKRWLIATRKVLKREPFHKNRLDRISVLKENQVLPYLWLKTCLLQTQQNLTQSQTAKILFPYDDERYIDIDIVEKLRKRTIPLAGEYFSTSSDGSIKANLKMIYSLRFLNK